MDATGVRASFAQGTCSLAGRPKSTWGLGRHCIASSVFMHGSLPVRGGTPKVDAHVHVPTASRHLIDRVGVSQAVVGMDDPPNMGHCDMHALVDATPSLTGDERAAILGGNAARLVDWH